LNPVKFTTYEVSGFLPSIWMGGVEIPTYFIVISIAFCVCILWLVRRADARSLDRNQALDLSLVVMGSGFVGARLFHVFFEEPLYYLESPLRVLEFWRGGFVWYGGTILAILAGVLYTKRKAMPVLIWLDTFAPVVALGYALGRVACVLTGCCYGVMCTLASGAKFRFPTQLLAVAWELIVLALLLAMESRRRKPDVPRWLMPSGRVFFAWLSLHAVGRILMEAFRDDPRGPELLGMSVSTCLSFLLLAGSLFFFWRIPGDDSRRRLTKS
jgi:phosphatidylglycerol:prolipoprotein diacylglycerol transferase